MKEIKQKTITDISESVEKFTGEIESTYYLYGRLKATEPDKALKWLVAGCVFAWARARQNEGLKKKIEEEMRRQRLFLHQNFGLDIQKDGDPIRKRYDPSCWLGNLPPDLNGNEEKEAYIGYRINCLREFMESLE